MGGPHNPYILIAGQGRSGTNWLLSLLDLCENTWCRNEPNELLGSAMASLPDGAFINNRAYPKISEWREALKKTGEAFGDRDSVGSDVKTYFRNTLFRHLVYFIYNKPRVRKPLEYIAPYFKQEEWAIPRFLLNESQTKNRHTIIKINQMPAWSRFVLEKDQSAKVIHIVRHPGGFLHSWMNRYLKYRNPDVVMSENKSRLEKLAGTSEAWSDRMGDINRMSLPETELWYWLYANEETYVNGKENSRYKLVIFENLADNFSDEVEGILDFSSLIVSTEYKDRLSELGNNSLSIANEWKKSLRKTEKKMASKILNNSELSGLWPV